MCDARNKKFRMPLKWKTALCGLVVVMAFTHCDLQMAGTSVGTGNPTEIEVAFKNDSGAVPITGDLSVYASTQIPVEGYAPAPLLKVNVNGMTQASLNVKAFQSLPDSLWPKGSKNGSNFMFNVVVTGDSQGVILKGFTWRKAEGDFVLRDEDQKPPGNGATAVIKGQLAPLVAFQGIVDTSNFSLLLDYYLFIYGTGYKAKVERGVFAMPNLPKDKYDGFLLSLPRKENQISGVDSASVYSLTTSLDAGTSNLTRGEVHERVLLPDSLRSN
ncbi:MAG: hypothetical protein JWO30_604 [Fibrobacteres bacterium]|nr:hypothetical protein [Fibrobacterota bacterium]